MTVCAGIEAGGTKFICGIGSGPDDLETAEFPTTSPAETISAVIRFFRARSANRPFHALGIGSFGPVDLQPFSVSYGHITTTPKPGWRDFDIAGALRQAFPVPIGFDTDVNTAALAESFWGAARGFSDVLYLTVGTGIGGGALTGGRLLHGLMHPEMGHLPVPHDLVADPFTGICPYHRDCLEGLASGLAMETRWGQKAQALPEEHPAWELESHYLALGLASWVYTLSPQIILMGGGVMHHAGLFPLVRRKLQDRLNGYIQAPAIIAGIDNYVLPPGLGDRCGVLGAIALAQQALKQTLPAGAEKGYSRGN